MDVFKHLIELIKSCYENGIKFKDGFQRQYILRQAYVEMFSLHAPGKKTGSALDVITMTNKEGHSHLGPMSARMLDYRTCKIKDKFGMSWSEWVDQPRYMVEEQIHIAVREINDELRIAKQTDDLLAQLRKAGMSDEDAKQAAKHMNKK